MVVLLGGKCNPRAYPAHDRYSHTVTECLVSWTVRSLWHDVSVSIGETLEPFTLGGC